MEGLRWIGMCIKLSSWECQPSTGRHQQVTSIGQSCIKRLPYKSSAVREMVRGSPLTLGRALSDSHGQEIFCCSYSLHQGQG